MMRRLLSTCVLLLVSVPAVAQPSLQVVREERAKYGPKVCAPEAIAILNAVALRSATLGLLSKTGPGNQWDGKALDILVDRANGHHFDVLTDSPDVTTNPPYCGLATPQEPIDKGLIDLARFVAPVQVATPPPAPPPPLQPVVPAPIVLAPAPVQSPLYIDPQIVLQQLAAIEAKTDALRAQLTEHDENPGWLRKFSASPAGIAIYTFLGTCLPTKCWRGTK